MIQKIRKAELERETILGQDRCSISVYNGDYANTQSSFYYLLLPLFQALQSTNDFYYAFSFG